MSEDKGTKKAVIGFFSAPFVMTVGLPLIAYQAWAEGYVLAKLWAWHAVPLGVRPIGWQAFAALALGWAILKFRVPRQKDDLEPYEQAMMKGMYFTWPWAALVVGWWFT